MATHSSILAWKTPWVEEAGGLESMGCKESDMTEQLASIHFTSTVTPGAVGLAGMHLGWDFSPSAALALGPDHSTQWASQVALVVKPPANAQDVKRCRFDPWVGTMPLGRVWQATHSSILVWRMPWTEEPRGLQSVGSPRVGHN